ncbi:phosphate/sulfate permease [Catalinimonas alkaloidigena]|uniref:Dabb family protein n=1 Tax=Catalinimonas alkaloidigena TaxID=1075417 RepID=UPI002404F5D4|nr:Dabb family protein [Catalinimonas alkaloidigena]MDF9795976.1 phosphate/sulfate permease [Catalinimonas alkaloidigena]
MKKISIVLSLILAITASSFIIHMQQQEDTLRHVVVFKYKEDASDADIKKVTDAFRDLQNTIPGIVSFEHGINNSPEGKNMGFTHVYTLTFEDAAARDTYLPHPEHKKFGELLGSLGVLEDAFVVDYHPMD